jgi:hypothetical protein
MARSRQVVESLNEVQEAEAQRIRERLKPLFEEELMQMARLVASKPDHQLFGQTEYELRDLVHRLGAQVLEAAADERQKKGRVRGC